MAEISEQIISRYSYENQLINYSRQIEQWTNLIINIRNDIIIHTPILEWGGQLNMEDLIRNIDDYEMNQIYENDEPTLPINIINEHIMPSKILSLSDTDYIKSICGFDNGCQICIEEFKEDEKIRRIPECSHAFHTDCIDSWFSNKNSCPVCRASVAGILDGKY